MVLSRGWRDGGDVYSPSVITQFIYQSQLLHLVRYRQYGAWL